MEQLFSSLFLETLGFLTQPSFLQAASILDNIHCNMWFHCPASLNFTDWLKL